MNDLIFDIKCHIASKTEKTWYLMYRYDPEFRAYAMTQEGIKRFRLTFNWSCYTAGGLSGGKTEWYLFHLLHRESDENGEQPAVIQTNGTKKYYKFGLLHRSTDEPAIIWSDGDLSYYKNGKAHRDNDSFGNSQPSFIKTNRYYEYHFNGLLHRDGDLPAIDHIEVDSVFYYKNGMKHRDDDSYGKPQPSVIYKRSKITQYYKNNIQQFH